MALSSLSTVNQALSNIHDTAKTAPMPLDAIEQRRQERMAERISAHEAMSKRMVAEEGRASGQATRATEAATALILQQLPPPPEDTESKEYVQWMRKVIAHTTASGDPGAMKLGSELAGKLNQMQSTGGIDPGTLGGATGQSQINLRAAQAGQAGAIAESQRTWTENQRQRSRIKPQALTDTELDAIDEAIKDYHPKATDKGFLGVPNFLTQPENRARIYNKIQTIVESSRAPGQVEVSIDDAARHVMLKEPLPQVPMGGAVNRGSVSDSPPPVPGYGPPIVGDDGWGRAE